MTAQNCSATPAVDRRRKPHMDCPMCGARGIIRSSEEVSPVLRRLDYQCTELECSATWVCSLVYEKTISPGGKASAIRPPRIRDEKPPGHDFGQMNIFEIIPKPPAA